MRMRMMVMVMKREGEKEQRIEEWLLPSKGCGVV